LKLPEYTFDCYGMILLLYIIIGCIMGYFCGYPGHFAHILSIGHGSGI